jgi:hypothetical protein
MDKNTLISTSTVVAQHPFGAIVEGAVVAKWDEAGEKIIGEQDTLRFVSDELVCIAVGKPRQNALGTSVALSFQKADDAGRGKPGITVWVNQDYLPLLDAVKIGGLCFITAKYTDKGVRPSGEFKPETIALRQLYPQ